MDLNKSFGFDEEKADGGVWVDIGDGGMIKVGKLGTVKYMNAIEKATRKYRAKLRANKPLTPEESIDVAVHADAEAILLDWKGIDENGQPLPCNRENKVRILTKYPDFRTQLEMYANDNDLFQNRDAEDDGKN